MLRKLAKRSLPEEKNELAVQRDVGIRWKETRTEEGVGAVRWLLPEDVRKRYESHRGAPPDDGGVIRPQLKSRILGSDGVSDIDGENSSGHERPITRFPDRLQSSVHRAVVRRSQAPKQVIPDRDHRVRWRSDDQVDRVIRHFSQLGRVTAKEADPPGGGHARGHELSPSAGDG